jgi:hypothetical protein
MWALVIGIGEFHDSALNLQSTLKDVQDFAAVLADSRYGGSSKITSKSCSTNRLRPETSSLS